MPVRGVGFIQGCNAQNVISEDKLVIATELTQDTTGTQWFEPMLAAALDAATLITAHRPPETSSTPAGQNAPAGQDSTAAHDSGIGQFLCPQSDTNVMITDVRSRSADPAGMFSGQLLVSNILVLLFGNILWPVPEEQHEHWT